MNNKQCDCGKDKVINDLLKRISNLEFEVESLEKYKARCEKAIDFINSTGYGTDFSMSAEKVDKLFNILYGSDK